MKPMNVGFETDSIAIRHTWFNPGGGEIHVDISVNDHSISLEKISDENFESSTANIAYQTECEGEVVGCKHQNEKKPDFLPTSGSLDDFLTRVDMPHLVNAT